MSLLSGIKTGVQKRSYIYMCYGPNGVGKSTFASQFPSPLFADLEKGSFHLNVSRIDNIADLESFKSLTLELLAQDTSYKTFVVDSVEALEVLILEAVKRKHKAESIEDIPYGKGFAESREVMTELMHLFRRLTEEKQITVVLIGHSQVRPQNDPAGNVTYDRYIMRCGDKMASVIRDLADNVFFITHKVFTVKENGKTKAFSDGQRIIYTAWRNAWDAKNRLDLPLELPLSYDALAEAIDAKPEANATALVSDIEAMSEKLDEKLKSAVKAQLVKFKNNPDKLKEIKNKLVKYVA